MEFSTFLIICICLSRMVCGEAIFQNFRYSVNNSVSKFLTGIIISVATERDLSENCRNDMRTLLQAYRNEEPWALQALDSAGQPNYPVIVNGSVFLGRYADCTSFKGENNISGKYCLTYLKYVNITDANSKIKVAICIPSSCSQNDINKGIQKSALDLYHKDSAIEAKLEGCFTDVSFSSDIATWAVILLFATIFTMTIAGTMYDVVTRKKYVSAIQLTAAEVAKTPPLQQADTPSANSSTSSNSFISTTDFDEDKKAVGATIAGILLSFSVLTNVGHIWNLNTPADQDPRLNVFHGIRLISMLWIIVGHSLSFAKQWIYFQNFQAIGITIDEILTQPIINGTFAVDNFFFLSGFLLTYKLLHQMKNHEGRIKFWQLYLHRYLRMTPAMMIVIAYSAIFLRYMGAGPTFQRATLMYDSWCRKNWWINALYLQNFIRRENMCLSHTWYSAVDMQFYVLAPLIIYICYKHSAIAGLILPFLVTTTVPIWLTFAYNLPSAMSNRLPPNVLDVYSGSYYIKPYCRMGPFLVGVALAHIMAKKVEFVKLNMRYRMLGWILTITVHIGVLYLMGKVNVDSPSEFVSALNNAFGRTAWAMTIAWIVYSCASGQARVLNSMLAFKYLIPFSKLTYTAFLIHPVIMAQFYGIFDHTVYFTWLWWVKEFLAIVTTTYIVSFLVSMLFEFPATNIEKFFRGR